MLTVVNDNSFVCLETSDLNDVGTYSFQVKAYFANYPEVNTESSVYKVNIIDPCNPPTITKPADQTVTYTISDVDATLDLSNQFSITPDFCPTSVVYTNSNTATLTNFEWDSVAETFKIPQFFDSLDIMDGEKAQKTYTVTLDVQYGNSVTPVLGKETVTITVVLKNPCVDKNYV